MAATAPARETYLKTHFDVWPGPTLSGSDSIGDGYLLTYLCYFTHFYDFEGKSLEKSGLLPRNELRVLLCLPKTTVYKVRYTLK